MPCFSFTSEPGTPDCLLLFTNPNGLKDCAFHPCVRCVHLFLKRYQSFFMVNFTNSLQRWTQNKTLSFIPPDGKFVLAEYRYSPSTSSSSISPAASLSNATREYVPIPFSLKCDYDVEEKSGKTFFPKTSQQAWLNLMFFFDLIPSFVPYHIHLPSPIETIAKCSHRAKFG